MGAILVVDDERSMREFLTICLKRAGHEVTVADDGKAAIPLIEKLPALDLVITDLHMPGMGGIGVLEALRKARPDALGMIITAYASSETAAEAKAQGAHDYLTKPFKVDEVLHRVELALEYARLRDRLHGKHRVGEVYGRSPAMRRVLEMIRKIAPTRTNVLVTGESGTGKELVARALHFESPRGQKAFVAVNCGAIPADLLESELFGHVKGAFTGATSNKQGLFQAAEGGTLFLDEIGELTLSLQVKLLRALQERKVKPVGGTDEEEVDVRVLAATNRDLEAEVGRGAFRQDLYYRLNVIQIHLPPLRQRREDVPFLVDQFVKRVAHEMGKPVPVVLPDALAALEQYDFPGNVRELENLIERAVTLESDGKVSRDSLPPLALKARAEEPGPDGDVDLPAAGTDLDRLIADYERTWVLRALKQAGGTRKTAARLLGITFRSLRYRLEKLGIEGGDEPSDD